MKCIILAGGFGSRITEESLNMPKPMITVGDKPILWHIMKIYSHYGVNDFIICTGYKEYVIKEYFMNYFLHNSDVTFDLAKNKYVIHKNFSENWNVSVVNTGLDTLTGGRMKQIYDYVKEDEMFFMTYGDGVADVNIEELRQFHIQECKLATLTAIKLISNKGNLKINNNTVNSFSEKSSDQFDWINGGFFCLSPKVIEKYIHNDVMFEKDPLQNLAKDNQLASFKHNGFWQCMDTMKERLVLEDMWNTKTAKWKLWY